MNLKPYLFLLCLLIIGCQNSNEIAFEPYTYENETCEDCPIISIEMPKALGRSKISKAINTALDEELIFLMSFEEETEVTSLEEAMQSFKNGYVKMRQLYSKENTPWKAIFNGVVTFEDANYITLALETYIFTGGAHGYSSRQFLNFDKKKGIEINPNELFNDLESFKTYAEKKFREKEEIPEHESINYSGLMFEEDTFYLPENMGFTAQGLTLIYNPYEVGSYADGAIEIVLPHKEITKYISVKPIP